MNGVRSNSLVDKSPFNLGTCSVMKDYRVTRRREQIFRMFAENGGKHLSAYDIYRGLKEREPFVGMATIYRTLDLFAKVGIIRAVEIGDGCKRYELCLGREGGLNPNRHFHLVCAKCGSVIEIDVDLLRLLKSKLDELEFEMEDIALIISGYCRECRYDTG